MWEIYDKLIEGIPESWTAESIARGSAFSYVKSRGDVKSQSDVISQGGLGLGGLVNYDMRMPLYTKNLEGLPLREVAQCIKSWNFYEASVGLAAINAYYNCPEIARSSGVPLGESRHVEDRIYDPFIMSQNEIRGKKVTVIGHFPFIETLFQPICDMRVIAGEIPVEGDYPFPAAEYLLPDSEYIYIGSSCFVEKTLPRLLELSCNAVKVTLVGPSTTLAPVLFEYGVHDLSGYVVKDSDRAMRMVRGAENGKIYSTGQKVSLRRK